LVPVSNLPDAGPGAKVSAGSDAKPFNVVIVSLVCFL
jgi:hypothetical protein